MKYLVWLAALLLASCAAIISVSGLTQLFGGGLILYFMFGGLEGTKLISAAALDRHWSIIPNTLRGYLVGGVIVLMFITSLGIYGNLSSNYQGIADQISVEDDKIELVENKILVYEERKATNKDLIDYKTGRVSSLTESANELSKGLSNNVIQYKDDEGNIITTTSSSTRKTLERQLDDVNEDIAGLNAEIDDLMGENSVLSDSIISSKVQISEIKKGSEVTAEVGPLRFLSDITGLAMGKVVNILMLLVVFVFDPMAITLVILGNRLDQIGKEEETPIEDPEPESKEYKIFELEEPTEGEPLFEVREEQEEIDFTKQDVGEEEPVLEEEHIEEEEPTVDEGIEELKKALAKVEEQPEEPKQPKTVLKGKIDDEDLPVLRGEDRNFSVDIPEPKEDKKGKLWFKKNNGKKGTWM